jgi:hypothetical protein
MPYRISYIDENKEMVIEDSAYLDVINDDIYLVSDGHRIRLEEETVKEILSMNPNMSKGFSNFYPERKAKIIKVGSPEHPATEAEIKSAMDALSKAKEQPINSIVELDAKTKLISDGYYAKLDAIRESTKTRIAPIQIAGKGTTMEMNSSNPKIEEALKEVLDIVHDRLKSKGLRSQKLINHELADFVRGQSRWLAEDDPVKQQLDEMGTDWSEVADYLKKVKVANKQQPLTAKSLVKGQVKAAAVASVGTLVVLTILKSINWNKVLTGLMNKILATTNAKDFLTEGAGANIKQAIDGITSGTMDLVDDSNPQIQALKSAGVDVNAIAENFLSNANLNDLMKIMTGDFEAEDLDMERLQAPVEEAIGISVES